MESNDLINKEKVNQLKSKNKYEQLKSNYILRLLFHILDKKKILNIVKYNKNMKKRINININDYKEYSEQYSSIEIEIKPIINKYGNFVNIKKEEEIYYHIYFNNNEKEIKRNYINEGEQIKMIKIIIDYQVKSFEELFCNCICIESIYFKKFHRININNMRCMFSGCSSLKELNLSNFITNNVIIIIVRIEPPYHRERLFSSFLYKIIIEPPSNFSKKCIQFQVESIPTFTLICMVCFLDVLH